jgi:hypothetical protein
MFELEVSVCDRFPAATPFTVRREPAREVFLLMRRMTTYNEHHKHDETGKQTIRRPAGDNWF